VLPAADWLFGSGLIGLAGMVRRKQSNQGMSYMFTCPHCEKQTISPVRKAILSPGLLVTCGSCSGASSLRYPSWLMGMLPGSIAMVAAMFVSSESVEWSLNIIGVLLMIAIPLMFAPLHKES
jgi:hypothetical protein